MNVRLIYVIRFRRRSMTLQSDLEMMRQSDVRSSVNWSRHQICRCIYRADAVRTRLKLSLHQMLLVGLIDLLKVRQIHIILDNDPITDLVLETTLDNEI